MSLHKLVTKKLQGHTRSKNIWRVSSPKDLPTTNSLWFVVLWMLNQKMTFTSDKTEDETEIVELKTILLLMKYQPIFLQDTTVVSPGAPWAIIPRPDSQQPIREQNSSQLTNHKQESCKPLQPFEHEESLETLTSRTSN